MKIDPGFQAWADLCEAVEQQAKNIGGHGRLVMEISITGGLPREMHFREREPKYLLGRSQPPLTGDSPLRRIDQTE